MADAAVYVARLGAKDETQAAFNSVQRNMNNTRKASQALNQQFRFMRGGLGQVGHQVQDIAVQLSMGTNAMLVFGQQGSQIASLFGPQGAMIGAVLAVAAAIGVSFTRDVKKGENALKDLEEHIKRQAKVTGELKKEYIDFLTLKFASDLETERAARIKNNQTIKDQKQILNESKNAQKLLTNAKTLDLTADQKAVLQTRDFTKEQKEANKAIVDAEAALIAGSEKVQDLTQKLGRLATGQNPFVDLESEAQKSKDAVASFIEGLDKSTISTEAGAVAAKAYELSLLDLKGAELDSALAALGRYEQSLLNAEADKKAAKATRERVAAEKAAFETALNANIAADQQREREEQAERKRRQASIDRLRTFEEFKNELSDTFLQMKKLEDGLVGVTENAMANFTDSFYDAISGAKNFKDAFKDMARSIVEDLSKMLIQYYITQQIFGAITSMFPGGGTTTSSGTTTTPSVNLSPGGYSPRAMGGSVTGGRPYLVGERGPELFVPNSSGGIVANNKLGGGGVTVVQNINISTGVQQTVRAEIANLLPQISNAAKAAVADSRMRGGGFSKALGGA